MKLYRRLWRWHFYAAFLVVPFVCLQSVTGVLYLWQDAWADWAHPELRYVKPTAKTASLDVQFAAAQGLQPGALASLMRVAADPRRSTQVMFANADGLPFPVFVDPYSGKVLGQLSAAQWMPGWTRKVHGGWPLGRAGSWLLELGACWAVVMIGSGLYLWWAGRVRERGLWSALWPQRGRGVRQLLIDLHASVAVLFSVVLLAFLMTALPWTDFWGNRVLKPVQVALNQPSPFGDVFAARSLQPGDGRAAMSLDSAVAKARAEGLEGPLQLSLGQAEQSPRIVRDQQPRSADRTALAFDRYSGETLVRTTWADFPPLPRAVAVGVDLHEGRFLGAANRWLNTALATALLWLSISGLASWWLRRPAGRLGGPARVEARLPVSAKILAVMTCVALPLLGISVLLLWLTDAVFNRDSRTGTGQP